jgi:peptide/nickel transport system permease protein
MFPFIIRRVLITIPLLFAASILTFLLVTNIGTPKAIEDAMAKPNPSAAQIASLNRQFGTDQPPVRRYINWSTSFVRGDWGKTPNGIEIRSLMWERMQVTIRLLFIATILSVFLGVVFGVISAIRQYTAFDYGATFFAFLFFSIPVAVLAGLNKEYGAIQLNKWVRQPSMSTAVLVLILCAGLVCGYLVVRSRLKYERERPPKAYIQGAAAGFGIALAFVLVFKLRWDGNIYRQGNPKGLIPTVGQATPGFRGSFWETSQDYFWHLLLPSLTIVLIGFAGYSRYMRASMLEALNSDYVRTARAKGISERRAIVRHAMRNALIPLVTIVAIDFGALIGGAIVVETIFGWSGMGKFFTDALTAKDPRALLAFVMVTAIFVIVFNLIADILYARLDPRIRLD